MCKRNYIYCLLTDTKMKIIVFKKDGHQTSQITLDLPSSATAQDLKLAIQSSSWGIPAERQRLKYPTFITNVAMFKIIYFSDHQIQDGDVFHVEDGGKLLISSLRDKLECVCVGGWGEEPPR